MPRGAFKSESFGEAEYRAGALERLENARALLEREQFAGSIYMAGRGVEGMLRALSWKVDLAARKGKASLITGHDLGEMLATLGRLGMLGEGAGDALLKARVQYVARLWFNNMRFASTRSVERRWRRRGVVGKRVTLKHAAAVFVHTCADAIERCETLYAQAK